MNKGNKKAIILILLGIAIMAVPFFLRMQEKARSEEFIHIFEQEDDKDGKNSKKDSKKEGSILSQENVIGIIEIPSLNIKYPIFEGTGVVQLNEGIGHMETTTELCGKGNCVLAGHNGSWRGTYFTYLCDIEEGAEVIITNKEKVIHKYIVKQMKIVNPYDAWVIEEVDTELLTLFTCANKGTKRFVVKCVPEKNYFSEGSDANATSVQTE